MSKQFKGLICKVIIAVLIFNTLMPYYGAMATEQFKPNKNFYSLFKDEQAMDKNQTEASSNHNQFQGTTSTKGIENDKTSQVNNTNFNFEEKPFINAIEENNKNNSNLKANENILYEDYSNDIQTESEERLFYKSDGGISTFSILNGIDVTVDKVIAELNKETLITITVTQNGLPLIGENVLIEGCSSGVTNPEGKYITTIRPQTTGSIRIKVKEVYYTNLLFSISSSQALLEVTAKDIQGNYLSNYQVNAVSNRAIYGRSTTGTILRMVVWQGQNQVLLCKTGTVSYYMRSELNVIPLTLNHIEFDGTLTVSSDLVFSYEGVPIVGGNVFVQSADIMINPQQFPYNRFVGNTDQSGGLTCFVTPGMYNFYVSGTNNLDEKYYLSSKDNMIHSSSSITTNWDSTNTGLLNVALIGNIPSETVASFEFNNFIIKANTQDSYRLSKDNYQLDRISLQYTQLNDEVYYEFAKHPFQPEIISILPGAPNNYELNLNFKESKITINPENISPNNTALISFNFITQSGHYLKSFNIFNSSGDFGSLDYLIKKPDATENTIKGWYFYNFEYYIPIDAQPGNYIISTNKDLGPLYGVQTASGTFTVLPAPDVNVDKLLINYNQESEITITASSGSVPIIGAEIIIDGQNISGITDANGQFTTRFTPNINGMIGIWLNDKYIRGKLFSVLPNEGVIEITANDKDNAPLQNFNYCAFSQNSSWSSTSDGTTDRLIAVEGQNTVIVSSYSSEGYYIVKNTTVLAGQVNKVNLDGASTVQIGISSKYNSTPVQFGSLRIKNNDFTQIGNERMMLQVVGLLNASGEVAVNVTPGSYTLVTNGYTINNERVFLLKENLPLINTGTNEVFNTAESETGVVNFTFNKGPITNGYTMILLNEYQIDFSQNCNVRITPGNYNISNIYVNGPLNNKFVNNRYIKSGNQFETLNIMPNSTVNYNFDVNLKEVKVVSNTQEINPGSNIRLSVKAITNSDHELANASNSSGVSYKITNPNNISQTLNGPLNGINYFVDDNAPSGLYTVEATASLGSLYPEQIVLGNFMVTDSPEIGLEGVKVTNTTPFNTQQNVAIDSDIVVEFNRSEVFGQMIFGQTNLRDVQGNLISCALRIEQNRVIIDPLAPLLYGTLYYVTIPSQAVADLNGNLLEGDCLFSFITEEEAVPFTLQVTNPQNSETNVPVNKKLLLAFSEEIVQGANFNGVELKTVDGTKINANIGIENRTIVISPQYALTNATNYVVVIPENAVISKSNSTGNVMYSLHFTTEVDNLAPIIISSNPLNNSNGFVVGNEISISFDDTINFVVNTTQVGNKKGEKAGTIELRDSLGNIVMVKASIDGNTLSIMPLSPMNYNTQYTLVIPKNFISDKVGNRNLDEYILNFTTAFGIPN